MNNIKRLITTLLFTTTTLLSSAEFTISSYNCGGLSDHYDYLRGVSMQKLMQERYAAESENMALNDRIQKTALKILFSLSAKDKAEAQQEWDESNYQEILENLTKVPTEANSPNTVWNQKMDEIITSYKIRPIFIYDDEILQMLTAHIFDLTKTKKGQFSDLLERTRAEMAKRIFNHHLKYDIICLQEGDYLKASMFPDHYAVQFSETTHSLNGVAWNTNKFELIETVGNILGRAYAVKLLEKESGKTVLVVSGHISGCNPYQVEFNAQSGEADSAKGDHELFAIIELFKQANADINVIGMDSNVTSLHPRLKLLKEANFIMDYENHIENTCTNPHQVLNTRIDWIAVNSKETVSIVNIPVLSVNLNNMQTNISDHKPIAAKIKF